MSVICLCGHSADYHEPCEIDECDCTEFRVDRLEAQGFHDGYESRGPDAAFQSVVSGLTIWRGKCGHLWDRADEDTDDCPRCLVASQLGQMEVARDAVASELRLCRRYATDLLRDEDGPG